MKINHSKSGNLKDLKLLRQILYSKKYRITEKTSPRPVQES